jgi:hypothetical protein
MAQTAAIMAALADAAAPLDAASLTARFRQGRRVAPKIASVLGALQRWASSPQPMPAAASACGGQRSWTSPLAGVPRTDRFLTLTDSYANGIIPPCAPVRPACCPKCTRFTACDVVSPKKS